MTKIAPGDFVVYEVAICEHPLVVGEEDTRTDEELIAEVTERTTATDGLTFPDWTVFVSDPPDEETIRYVNTASRINVLGTQSNHIFEQIYDRLTIDGWDRWNDREAEMSYWDPTHPDDFEGPIHLDLTE